MTPEQALRYLQDVADDKDVNRAWPHVEQAVRILKEALKKKLT